MRVFELGKSIEAIRLNKRNGLPMGEPPRTIPFGALVEDTSEKGDRATFIYLGELYEANADVLRSALLASHTPQADAQRTGQPPEPDSRQGPKRNASLQWETIDSSDGFFSRARVPGGWLVMSESRSIAFVPDEQTRW